VPRHADKEWSIVAEIRRPPFLRVRHQCVQILNDRVKSSVLKAWRSQRPRPAGWTRGKAPLCGNSVHVDRAFLGTYCVLGEDVSMLNSCCYIAVKEMPTFVSFLHYRIIDVSTLKELAYRCIQQSPSKLQPRKRNAPQCHIMIDVKLSPCCRHIAHWRILRKHRGTEVRVL